MVKLAFAGASGQLSRAIIDRLAESNKHEIIALIRKNPEDFPQLAGVQWIQTNYEDKSELVKMFQGVDAVLCFFPVHLDPGSVLQKRLIDAAIEAGVRRFAPSEWAVGLNLASSIEFFPHYAGKLEVAAYLEEINKDKKVIEYCRFQPGMFLDYAAHPYPETKYLETFPLLVDIEERHANMLEAGVQDSLSVTSVEDIAHVVALAVEYEGEWPTVGGIRGSSLTLTELLRIGESIRGESFTVDRHGVKDLESGEAKIAKPVRMPAHYVFPGQEDGFAAIVTSGILISISRGVWTVSDEWNRLLPAYKFSQAEDFVRRRWAARK